MWPLCNTRGCAEMLLMSQGAAVAYAMSAEMPAMGEKLSVIIAMGPSIFLVRCYHQQQLGSLWHWWQQVCSCSAFIGEAGVARATSTFRCSGDASSVKSFQLEHLFLGLCNQQLH
jgi:hypothetical protein